MSPYTVQDYLVGPLLSQAEAAGEEQLEIVHPLVVGPNGMQVEDWTALEAVLCVQLCSVVRLVLLCSCATSQTLCFPLWLGSPPAACCPPLYRLHSRPTPSIIGGSPLHAALQQALCTATLNCNPTSPGGISFWCLERHHSRRGCPRRGYRSFSGTR